MTTTLPDTATPETSSLPRVRGRRNPVLLAAGAALVVTGAAGVAWLVTSVADTKPVLVTTHSLDAGEVIGLDDLAVAQVSLDPTVASVPASQRDSIVGQRTATALAGGQLLTPGSVTDAPLPEPGSSLVGVAVSPSQLPAADLKPGDPVTLVAGFREGSELPTAPPSSMPAAVAGTRTLDDGRVVVDVTVPTARAAMLAGWVSTGRVVIVREAVGGR